MKTLLTLSLLLSTLFVSSAHASSAAVENIDRAYSITEVEMSAIYSGRYQYYRPETIRNVISQLLQLSRGALATAEDQEARGSLVALTRSLEEEYNYSYRFQVYRLASTQLLLVNYQRLLNLAKRSELALDNPGHGNGCNVPANSRVGCIN